MSTIQNAPGIFKILTNMPCCVGRRAASPEDWGDDETVGLQVKTRDTQAFGMFCGRHDGKFAVGKYNGWTWDIGEVELFDSEDEMKERWMLD